MRYAVVIEKANGNYSAYVPDLPGCIATGDTVASVERGEVDGNAGTSWVSLVSLKPDWLRDKKINVLLQMANRKHPDLGHVPLALDFARNEQDLKVLDLIFSRLAMAYPFAAPPDVPPARLQALRHAFDATMKDPELLADAKRQNLEISPVSAGEIAAILRSVYASPADVIARARTVLESGKAVK